VSKEVVYNQEEKGNSALSGGKEKQFHSTAWEGHEVT
jgi:hypothetical protein